VTVSILSGKLNLIDMKFILKTFVALVCVSLFTACSPTSFYQLYKVESTSTDIIKVNSLEYEDSNCVIRYNLWSNGGDVGFSFYNKTDKDIQVYLNKSHFILNGYAYDYFKNRTYTSSQSRSVYRGGGVTRGASSATLTPDNRIETQQVSGTLGSSLSSSAGYAVSMAEDSVVCVPARTTKRFSEYSINSLPIRHCDLLRFPRNKRQIETKEFTISNSPIVFSNRITYRSNGNYRIANNEFYVSQMTNYPALDFVDSKFEEACGSKTSNRISYFKYQDVDHFYLKYNLGQSGSFPAER